MLLKGKMEFHMRIETRPINIVIYLSLTFETVFNPEGEKVSHGLIPNGSLL